MTEHGELLKFYRARVDSYDTDETFGLAWSALCRHLLAFGGSLVVPPLEPEPRVLDLLGESPYRGVSVLRRGEANSCHGNSAALWATGDVDVIVTGYALTLGDGLWRQHTWGLRTTGRRPGVVETTTRRDVYLGVELRGAYALRFAAANAQDVVMDVLAHGGPQVERLLVAAGEGVALWGDASEVGP